MHCRKALALLEALGDRSGIALTRDSLGYAHHQLGQHSEAIAEYQLAVELYRELGDYYQEAITLAHLGDAQFAWGDSAAAQDSWQRAVRIYDEQRHPDAEKVRAKLRRLR